MNKLMKNKEKYVRIIIQLLCFFTIRSAYNSAFSGVKYIFTQIGNTKLIEMTSFVTVLVVLCVYTMLFGRFFCGFACSFGAFGDLIRGIYVMICKKLHKKPVRLPANMMKFLSNIKFFVLVFIVLSCFTGIYSKFHGYNPWEVFSMIASLNFNINGYAIGIIILILIIIGDALQERFFCRVLCPLGAIFSMLPVLPIFTLHRNRKECFPRCNACTRVCPADIELPEYKDFTTAGECFQCQKCISICPKKHIGTSVKKLKGNEIIFTFVKIIILLTILLYIGY